MSITVASAWSHPRGPRRLCGTGHRGRARPRCARPARPPAPCCATVKSPAARDAFAGGQARLAARNGRKRAGFIGHDHRRAASQIALEPRFRSPHARLEAQTGDARDRIQYVDRIARGLAAQIDEHERRGLRQHLIRHDRMRAHLRLLLCRQRDAAFAHDANRAWSPAPLLYQRETGRQGGERVVDAAPERIGRRARCGKREAVAAITERREAGNRQIGQIEVPDGVTDCRNRLPSCRRRRRRHRRTKPRAKRRRDGIHDGRKGDTRP